MCYTSMLLTIFSISKQRKIQVSSGSRVAVKHLVSYGSGVWASVWKSPMLHLYHNETFECLQSLSVVTPLTRMKNGEYRPKFVIINVEVLFKASVVAFSVTRIFLLYHCQFVANSVQFILLVPVGQQLVFDSLQLGSSVILRLLSANSQFWSRVS